MRKTIKSILLLAIIALMLVSLTACGNKLVATKTEEEGGMSMKETREIHFKKDKADRVIWTVEFNDEITATSMYGLIASTLSEESSKQEGKKLTFDVSAEDFEATGEELGGETKEEIKAYHESEGYEVKE